MIQNVTELGTEKVLQALETAVAEVAGMHQNQPPGHDPACAFFAAPGYFDYAEGGRLTGLVRRNLREGRIGFRSGDSASWPV